MAMKRLIICCDGTWNDADSAADYTNVVRIARAIKAVDERDQAGTKQIVYYHSGIGSGGDTLMQVIGGGTGLGLSRNVRDAYAFIANNYCDGDELFFFGFSRGAFTVRSVAGLIGWAGIIHKTDMDDFALLWEGFKTRKTANPKGALVHFPDRHKGVPIKCIGVWDTVGALGIPGHLNALLAKLYEFQDADLGLRVENAFHALALDEHRGDFVPTLWSLADAPVVEQNLEQVWFAGSHSNVGGGYPEHGLSDIALAWMVDRVSPFLDINLDYLSARQDQTDAWALSRLYDSATGIFGFFKTRDRNVLVGSNSNEAIHESVIARLNAGQAVNGGPYAPKSLPQGLPAGAQIARFGDVENKLRWQTADKNRDGKSDRPAPEMTDPLMKKLHI